ncbi:MAG: DUF2066 domain-containing protein [bacterium]|nr:DUF2066 domain-containing protein [bacterium]
MSKLILPVSFSIILGVLAITAPVSAQVGPKNGDTWTPNLPGPAPAVANPLVVTDVVVDKEAENSVVAREKAINDSRREAFKKLAERNMTPAEFKSFKMPKDSEIQMLVQDFEIQDEQMSTTRYVGTFTIRFRDAVRNYMTVKDDAPEIVDAASDENPGVNHVAVGTAVDNPDPVVEEDISEDPQTAMESRPDWKESIYGQKARPALVRSNTPPPQEFEPIAKSVLILPYVEDVAGQTLLWEEQNPWLLMWQGALPKSAANGRQFYVPLGDISDIAAGPGNGVWEGNYRAVDKLLANYHAEQAVLAVVNRSGTELTIEIYTYTNGKLRRRDTLRPYAGEMTATEAYRRGITETISYLQAPYVPRRPSLVSESISRELTAQTRAPGDTLIIDSRGEVPVGSGRPSLVMQQGGDYAQTQGGYVAGEAWSPAAMAGSTMNPGAGGATRLEATMQFSDSRSWMDMQKRLAGMNPPVQVDISSLSSNSATFTLSSSAPIGAVKQSLYSRGVELRPPSVQPGGRAVYDLRLAPLTR